ncbi:MAG TPA: terminase small subunit [Firmicutes bacterium]|nr:terminase small subunit [Bacillota bacterium]
MANLNDRQERFCQEYIIDLNGKQAAIRAGYSEKTAEQIASRLLRNVKVSARIEELQKKVIDKIGLNQEWVLKELQRVYSRCIVPEEIEKWDYEQRQLIGTGEFMFDSKGANRSLELLGKHLGMFADKLKIEDTTNYADKYKAARERAKNARKQRGIDQ